MENSNILVSVVMGCYNNEKTIKRSIDSILNQTIKNIEVIIIDDFSNDNTYNIVTSIKDKRIRCYRNLRNLGLGYSLNKGVTLARGRYIARMDADDISMKHRLSCQVKFLQAHPDVVCVGTSARKIGKISLRTRLFSNVIKSPITHEEIKTRLLIGTPMLHPTVMFNRKLLLDLQLNYDSHFRRAQDYELWTRLIWLGKMANISKKLLAYRYSASQASSVARSEQIQNSRLMYRRMLEKLMNRAITEEEITMHQLFATKNKCSDAELLLIEKWLNYIITYVDKTNCYDRDSIRDFFARRRITIYRESLTSRVDRVHKYYANKYFANKDLYSLIKLLA